MQRSSTSRSEQLGQICEEWGEALDSALPATQDRRLVSWSNVQQLSMGRFSPATRDMVSGAELPERLVDGRAGDFLSLIPLRIIYLDSLPMWIVALALRRPYTFVVMALLILILSPIVI